MSVIFTVPGEPQGKARPRVTKFGAYTPEKTVAYEQLIRTQYMAAAHRLGERPDMFAEQDVTIVAYFRIPKSEPAWVRQAMLEGNIRPKRKPDLDNIIKVVCDALNKFAWHDDAQVTHVACAKYYGATPHLQVEIRAIQEEHGHETGTDSRLDGAAGGRGGDEKGGKAGRG